MARASVLMGVVACAGPDSGADDRARAFASALELAREEVGARSGELFVDPRPFDPTPPVYLPQSFASADPDVLKSREAVVQRQGLKTKDAVLASRCWGPPMTRLAPAYPGSDSMTDDQFREWEERCGEYRLGGTYLVFSAPQDRLVDDAVVAQRFAVIGFWPGCRRFWEVEVDLESGRARMETERGLCI